MPWMKSENKNSRRKATVWILGGPGRNRTTDTRIFNSLARLDIAVFSKGSPHPSLTLCTQIWWGDLRGCFGWVILTHARSAEEFGGVIEVWLTQGCHVPVVIGVPHACSVLLKDTTFICCNSPLTTHSRRSSRKHKNLIYIGWQICQFSIIWWIWLTPSVSAAGPGWRI